MSNPDAVIIIPTARIVWGSQIPHRLIEEARAWAGPTKLSLFPVYGHATVAAILGVSIQHTVLFAVIDPHAQKAAQRSFSRHVALAPTSQPWPFPPPDLLLLPERG